MAREATHVAMPVPAAPDLGDGETISADAAQQQGQQPGQQPAPQPSPAAAAATTSATAAPAANALDRSHSTARGRKRREERPHSRSPHVKPFLIGTPAPDEDCKESVFRKYVKDRFAEFEREMKDTHDWQRYTEVEINKVKSEIGNEHRQAKQTKDELEVKINNTNQSGLELMTDVGNLRAEFAVRLAATNSSGEQLQNILHETRIVALRTELDALVAHIKNEFDGIRGEVKTMGTPNNEGNRTMVTEQVKSLIRRVYSIEEKLRNSTTTSTSSSSTTPSPPGIPQDSSEVHNLRKDVNELYQEVSELKNAKVAEEGRDDPGEGDHCGHRCGAVRTPPVKDDCRREKVHCHHVDDLLRRVAFLEDHRRFPQRPAGGGGGRGPDRGDDHDHDDDDHDGGDGPGAHGGPRGQGLNIHRLFDDKVAISQNYSYDGGSGGESWRVRTKGYWVAKCPALLPVLNWAEERDELKITEDDIHHAATTLGWTDWQRDYYLDGGKRVYVDLKRIDEIIWGFLNMSLKGEAHRHLELAKMLHGLEAWRIVVQTIHRGRNNRHAALRKLIRNPQQIVKIEDIERGITTFDNNLREYEECGGSRPTDEDLKSDLLDSLPGEIRENLLWRTVKRDEPYETFRNHVKMQANSVLYHRGKLRGQMNVVNDQAGTVNDDSMERLIELVQNIDYNGDDREELIGAIIRKIGGPARPGPRAPRAGASTPTDARVSTAPPKRCINCGSADHLARECSKPQVAPNKRPCFKCGKPGHIGSACRSGGASVRTLEENDEPASFGGTMCAVMTNEDFELVTLRKSSKPQSRPATLGDFIPTETKNTFETLTKTEDVVSRNALASLPQGRPGYPGMRCKSQQSLGRQKQEDKIKETTPREQREEDREWECYKATFRGDGHPSGASPAPTDDLPNEVQGAIGVPADELRSETSNNGQTSPIRGNKKKKGRMLQRLMWAEATHEEPNTPASHSAALGRAIPGRERAGATQSAGNKDLEIDLFEFQDSEDEILNTEEDKVIEIAIDSGCVAHCTDPDDIPCTVEVKPPPPGAKDFVGAGGHSIKRHGKAEVLLVQENGMEVSNVFQVADVTRPLHSVSEVTDTDKEVLFTEGECVVVPGGSLSKYLKGLKIFARYGRRGGLYTARMRVRDPKRRREPKPRSGFTRPGAAR